MSAALPLDFASPGDMAGDKVVGYTLCNTSTYKIT